MTRKSTAPSVIGGIVTDYPHYISRTTWDKHNCAHCDTDAEHAIPFKGEYLCYDCREAARGVKK